MSTYHACATCGKLYVSDGVHTCYPPTAAAPDCPRPLPAHLTKREAFAMAAMQGILARNTQGIATSYTIARWAIEQADALLAELAKGEG